LVGQLPVTYEGDRIVVGVRPSTVAHRVSRSCPHGTFPASVFAEYGPDGELAYVEADCLDSSYRAYTARYRDSLHELDPKPPTTLSVEARTAVLHWTDRWWDPDEAPPRQPDDPVWYGVDVDLAGGQPSEPDYDDFFPFTECQKCADDEGLLRLGVCIGMTGRIHGLFLEALASALPRPTNSTERTPGVWPMHQLPRQVDERP